MEGYKVKLLKMRDDVEENKELFDNHKNLDCFCPACKSVANIDRELLEVSRSIRVAKKRGKTPDATKKNEDDLLEESYSIYVKLSGSIKSVYRHYNKEGRMKNEFTFR